MIAVSPFVNEILREKGYNHTIFKTVNVVVPHKTENQIK